MTHRARIFSYDWTMYDQGKVVYRAAQMSVEQLRDGRRAVYHRFYSASSIASRFPGFGGARKRGQWLLYNLFMRKASRPTRDIMAAATPEPETAPMPPILPVKHEWREAVLDAARRTEAAAG